MFSRSPVTHVERRTAARRGRCAVTVAALAACLVLGACGGGTETVVQTVTVPVGGSTGAGASTTPAPPTTTAPAATTAAAGVAKPPLPGGRPAIDGRYLMEQEDYTPPQIMVGGNGISLDGLPWSAETTCDPAGDCTLALRRGLQGGGSKNLELKPDGDDDRTWSVQTTGASQCGGDETPPGPYRLSVRATKVAEIDGRPTATELVSYLRAGVGDIPGCDFDDSRSRTTYRGSRDD